MPKRTLRFFWPIIVAISLCHFSSAQNNAANRADDDEAALRRVIGSYFELYAKKEIEPLSALFSTQSPILASRQETWRRMFPLESYQFTAPLISRVRVEESRGFARVATERTAMDKNGVVTRKTEMRVEYTFVKEDGQWKIFGEASATMGLFGDLQAAKTDAERERLLAGDPFLVTRELLFQLSSQSDYAYTAAQYDRAMNLLLAARMVAEHIGDKKEEANAWQNIGIIHFVKLRYPQALDAYQRAHAIYEALGRQSEAARVLTSIGLVHTALGKYPLALEFFTRGLAIHEALNEPSEISRTLDNIGALYYEQGDYARASNYFQKSLPGLEASRSSGALIGRLIKIAKTEYEQGNDAAAIDFYERAVSRAESAGAADSRGFALHSIANILYTQGDYPQALLYYQKGLKAQTEAGNKQGEASALQGIALIHSINGDHALALSAYEQCLAIAQLLNDRSETAAAQSKVGGALYALGKLHEAVAAFERALTLREELKDPQDIAFSLLDLGVTWFALNDNAKALELYERSRALYQAVNNSDGVAAVLLNMALVHYSQQDYAEALELADQATALAKASGENDLYWQSRHRAGKAHYKLHNLDAARQAFTDAIASIETYRAQAGKPNQPRFYENRLAPYQALVDVLIEQKQGNDAFNVAERAKARALLGVMQSGKVWVNKTMTAQERAQESRLTGDLARLNAQLARESDKERPNKLRLDELRLGAQKARADYEAFRGRLYARRPMLKVLRGEGKPLDIGRAVLLANDSRTALLDFVETDERLYLFAFTKSPKSMGRKPSLATPLRIYLLSAGRAELGARITHLNQSIAQRDAAVEMEMRELYGLLLEPAREQLAGIEHLIIVPDGALWSLPFAALRMDDGRYLIEACAISQVPLLTALNAITRRNAPIQSGRARTAPSNAPMLLALANPALSLQTIERFKPLLGTEAGIASAAIAFDADALGRLYGPKQSLILAGSNASEERVKAEAGKYRILHLAARGATNEAAPLFSSIALAALGTPGASPNVPKEDGVLDLREIIGLDLRADLAAFPAVEPLRPQAGAGRSLTAFQWAFFIAGCSTTLVSQWRVESPGTSELMAEFHRALKISKRKAASWQIAVKAMLAREEYRSPYFWAGFAMLGDAR